MNDAQRSPDDFEQVSARLESAVLDACRRCEEWPAKVAAGIYAALDFAVDDKAASRCLAIERPRSRPDERRYALTIDRFAKLLGAQAPQRRLVSTDRAAIRSVAAMIAEPLRSGHPQRLTEIGPELLQLLLVPYLGFAEAKSWAERTSRVR